MRRIFAGLGVLAFAGVLVFGGALPASADGPPPGPVDPIPELPSKTVIMTPSGTGSWTAADWWRAVIHKAGSPGTAVATIPKPITVPAVIGRTLVGAEAPLAAGMAGWAIGSNGAMVLIGAMTGSDYGSVSCSQPDWYQAVTTFINLGFGPDCSAYVPVVSPDTYTGIAGGGASWQILQTTSYLGPGSVPQKTLCVKRTYTTQYFVVSGFATEWEDGGSIAGCSGAANHWRFLRAPFTIGTVTIRASNGTLLASGVPTLIEGATSTRTPRCTVHSGSESWTAEGDAYTESGGLPLSAPGLGCEQAYEDFVSAPGHGPGLLPDRITVESEDDGGAITEISDQEVPAMTEPQKQSITAPGTGGLVLSKVVGTTTDSCNTWAADCSGWWEASDEGTNGDTYKCSFNGQPVALVECGPYRNTFDTQTETPTVTDPLTGEDVEWSSKPSTGNSTSPATGPGTADWPADKCFADGWASVANPLDWVLLPVKCALVWAFVPRASEVDGAGTRMMEAWEPTIFGKLPVVVAPLFVVPDLGSGCMGPHVFVPLELNGADATIDWYPLAACESPGSDVAAWARNIGAVLLVFATALGIINRISSMVRVDGPGKEGS